MDQGRDTCESDAESRVGRSQRGVEESGRFEGGEVSGEEGERRVQRVARVAGVGGAGGKEGGRGVVSRGHL